MIIQNFSNGYNVLDKFKHLAVSEIKEIADSDRLPFAVLCLNLEKDLNIANIIRSSHLLGAKDVFTLGWNKVDSRGMVGCQNYTNLYKIKIDRDCSEEVISDKIKEICFEYKYNPVFVEHNDYSISYKSRKFRMAMNHRPLLIFGNEGKGISENILDDFQNKNIFHIPQRGVIRSLNVSSAASIVISEASNFLSKNWFMRRF